MPRMIPRDGVEVYASDGGYVCIKQVSPFGEESLVTLEPSQVPIVIRWMQAALPVAEQVFSSVEEEELADAVKAS